jgi:hypothetical protein
VAALKVAEIHAIVLATLEEAENIRNPKRPRPQGIGQKPVG